MELYPLIVFLHVTGGVIVVGAIGVEILAFHRLRTATVEEAPTLVWLLVIQARTIGLAMGVVLATGGWMAATRWGMPPWMTIALVAVVALAVSGMTILRRRVRMIGRVIAPADATSAAVIRTTVHDPVLRAAVAARAGLTMGILGLMTVKPGVVGALAMAVGSALVGGLAAAASSRPQAQRRQSSPFSTPDHAP
jgi:hypothetical protein